MRPIIAPFWADVDTRSGSGRVYYKQTTSIALRSRVARRVQMVYGENFTPTHLFIATWYRVGYYNRHMNRVSVHVYAPVKLLTVLLLVLYCSATASKLWLLQMPDAPSFSSSMTNYNGLLEMLREDTVVLEEEVPGLASMLVMAEIPSLSMDLGQV